VGRVLGPMKPTPRPCPTKYSLWDHHFVSNLSYRTTIVGSSNGPRLCTPTVNDYFVANFDRLQHHQAMSFSDLKFAEDLPDQCPNGDASRKPRQGYWRFVMVKYPGGLSTVDCKAFSSQHGRGKACPPSKDPCDWASCSMFSEPRARKMALIPPFKNKPAVCLNITPDAGPSRVDEDGHLHLWCLEDYDLTQDITKKVEKL